MLKASSPDAKRVRFSGPRLMVLSAVMALIPATSSALESLSPEEARAIAKDAYIYGFPMVDNYRIQCSYFVDRNNPDFKAPWNTINSVARVFTPEDKAIQTPNSDTPYSQLGADLRAEPLVISVPDVEAGRYYSLQFIDMYTFNFAYVGSRATGNGAGNFLLAGPHWSGEKPEGIKAVIKSETDFDFVLYRTQLFNAGDIDDVKKVQAGYKVRPLSQFLGQPAPSAPRPVDWITPLPPEEERASPRFFEILNFVLQFCPTHPSETALMERFAKIDIGAGKRFNFDALAPELQQAVRDGMADAWKEFAVFKSTQIDTGKRPASEAFGTREFMNSDYMARMSAAALGIYGNSKEEALYPAYFVDAGGGKLDGSNRYALSFAPGQLPPVSAFWSLTVYELPASLLYANPINRYLINSPMLPRLKRDAGGKVTISGEGSGIELAADSGRSILGDSQAILAEARSVGRTLEAAPAGACQRCKPGRVKAKRRGGPGDGRELCPRRVRSLFRRHGQARRVR